MRGCRPGRRVGVFVATKRCGRVERIKHGMQLLTPDFDKSNRPSLCNSSDSTMADSADPPAAHMEASKPSDTEDRSSLLSRAQSFLQSPQVAARDYASKRQFLQEKGLGEQEIDTLLKNVVSFSFIR